MVELLSCLEKCCILKMKSISNSVLRHILFYLGARFSPHRSPSMMHAFVHESGSELQATSFTRATINSSMADTNLEKQLIDTNGLVYEGKYKSSSQLNEHCQIQLSHSFPMLTSTKNKDLLNREKADNQKWDNGNKRYFYKYLT